jgi:ParB-like chromosome segregation protein Spo0J
MIEAEPQRDEADMPAPFEIVGTLSTRRVDELRPHPRNAEIYDERSLTDHSLYDSIKALRRVITPLTILPDGTVLSGHRRLDAAERAGLEEVPVIIRSDLDEFGAEQFLLESNIHRDKSIATRLREYRALLQLEKKAAAARKGRRSDLRKNFSAGGRAGDLAASKVKLSRPTADKGLRVLMEVEEHQDDERSKELLRILNKSIDAAAKKVVEFGWMKPPARKVASRVSVSRSSASQEEQKIGKNDRGDELETSSLPARQREAAGAGPAGDEAARAQDMPVATVAETILPLTQSAGRLGEHEAEKHAARLQGPITEEMLLEGLRSIRIAREFDTAVRYEDFARKLSTLLNEHLQGRPILDAVGSALVVGEWLRETLEFIEINVQLSRPQEVV